MNSSTTNSAAASIAITTIGRWSTAMAVMCCIEGSLRASGKAVHVTPTSATKKTTTSSATSQPLHTGFSLRMGAGRDALPGGKISAGIAGEISGAAGAISGVAARRSGDSPNGLESNDNLCLQGL